MASETDKLVADYLKRLNAELRDLPRARRHDLTQEISEHITEGRALLEPEDEAGIRNMLDGLGAPRLLPRLASVSASGARVGRSTWSRSCCSWSGASFSR
jgi:hypothetical protein